MERGEKNLRNQLGVDLALLQFQCQFMQPRCVANGGTIPSATCENQQDGKRFDEDPLIGLETVFQCRRPPKEKRRVWRQSINSGFHISFSACAFEFQF